MPALSRLENKTEEIHSNKIKDENKDPATAGRL